MKTFFILIAVTVLGLAGCSKYGGPTRSTETRVISSASAANGSAEFLYNLYHQGKLPGLSKDDHGELTTTTAKVTGMSAAVQFPFSQTYRSERNSGSTYNCTVEMPSMRSGWRLAKAWETDAAGNTLKEYPIQ